MGSNICGQLGLEDKETFEPKKLNFQQKISSFSCGYESSFVITSKIFFLFHVFILFENIFF